MASYTVNISGTLNSSHGYVTINGTKITSTGTRTYTSKPAISVYVGASNQQAAARCTVSLNGGTVQTGSGSYALNTEAETIDIAFSTATYSARYTYYNAAITATEPVTPPSEHYTNIGGTAREIEGGTVLIGGVLREIESGTVLVGGVAREIEFAAASNSATMTVTSNTSTGYNMQIVWDGGSHTDPKKSATYSIPIGTKITFRIPQSDTIGGIRLNGSVISSTSLPSGQEGSYKFQYYDYVLNGNITVTTNADAVFKITEE